MLDTIVRVASATFTMRDSEEGFRKQFNYSS